MFLRIWVSLVYSWVDQKVDYQADSTDPTTTFIGPVAGAAMVSAVAGGAAPDLRQCPKCGMYGHGIRIDACPVPVVAPFVGDSPTESEKK